MTRKLSYERLVELLDYCPGTGNFYWRVKRGNKPPGSLAGSYNGLGYLTIRIDYVLYYGHRLAWLWVTGEHPENEIDHRDLNPSNNTFHNLRPSSHGENQANQPLDRMNTSGRKGVSWNKEKRRWEVRIGYHGKSHFVGYFHDLDEAGRAYETAAVTLFGQFARAA